MLSEEKYGDKYEYPAIYKSPGIVWDQSSENKVNGDWMMTSRMLEIVTILMINHRAEALKV